MAITYTDGFYDVENDGLRDFRWMQRNGWIEVPGDCSHISFEYGLDADSALLKISGKKNLEFPLHRGWKRIVASMQDLGDTALHFECSNLYDIPCDARELSLQVSVISQPEQPVAAGDVAQAIPGEIHAFVKKYCLPDTDEAYLQTHARRYGATLNYFEEHCLSPQKCLEVGSGVFFSSMLEKIYPTAVFVAPRGDIRNGYQFHDATYDTIIAMEVMEHFTDQTGFYEIQWDGLFAALWEIDRLLNDQGLFFVTTPNVCSFSAINRAINHRHPQLCRNHYTEYTYTELSNILNVFFDVESIDTFNVFSDDKYDWSVNLDNKNRGDDIFVLCRKRKNTHTKREAYMKMYEAVFPGSLGVFPELRNACENKFGA